MAFTVRLFRFSKRNNSTARPSGGTSFPCTIKAESGVLNPDLIIDFGGAASFSDYNYAYIPDFDRYYWISEMINMGPVWNLKLRCDSLASWRDTIGGTSLYVLRSSAESDGNIMDTYYPASTDSTLVIKNAESALWAHSDTDLVVIGDGEVIIGVVSKKRIDEINILQATYEAMRQAIAESTVEPEILLNDAVTIPGVNIKQVPIIKGDAKSISIGAASIIAKVTRDRMMVEYDKMYPMYHFASNKGYGSAEHIAALKEYGPCPIHRRSFIGNFVDF